MEDNGKQLSNKQLYVASGVAVTIGMVTIKLVAMAINKAVATMLGV